MPMQHSTARFTAQNFYISKFYHLALNKGLDADAMLARFDIARDLIDVPQQRIEVEKLAGFIIAICDALQDESMSLSSSPVPRGSFYMMGKLTVHEPTLKKALLQIKRFFSMVTRSFTVKLETKGNKAYLTFDLLNPELDADHLFAEMNLMMLHRYSSWLIAENITLSEVFFSYAPPPQVKDYAFLFPGKHRFNAPAMGFSFKQHYLDRATVQNIGTMKAFMRRCPMELFTQPKTDFTMSSEVHGLLYRQLKDQSPSLPEVAASLLMTQRTLIRRLKDEGTSFQELKDLVRRDRAIYYLTSQSASVSEIAGKVGYTDASVFTRAFRSWTGVSPRQYRQKFLKQQ